MNPGHGRPQGGGALAPPWKFRIYLLFPNYHKKSSILSIILNLKTILLIFTPSNNKIWEVLSNKCVVRVFIKYLTVIEQPSFQSSYLAEECEVIFKIKT